MLLLRTIFRVIDDYSCVWYVEIDPRIGGGQSHCEGLGALQLLIVIDEHSAVCRGGRGFISTVQSAGEGEGSLA